jgi:hypothetical protein
VDSNTLSSALYSDVRERRAQWSPLANQAAGQLTKGDLPIVTFVSSLWLWATVWALTSAALDHIGSNIGQGQGVGADEFRSLGPSQDRDGVA